MKLRILNCPDKDFKPYLVEAFEFYSKELIPNTRIRNNCSTTIKFDSSLDVYGSAQPVGYNTKNLPRKFLIELHPGIGAKNILKTLAHEMIHVKQYVYNETDEYLSMWRGKKINHEKVDYWKHPWEIDAYGNEAGLMYNFAIKYSLWEVFEDFVNPTTPIIPEKIRWKGLTGA
jgi:hypothetical protein